MVLWWAISVFPWVFIGCCQRYIHCSQRCNHCQSVQWSNGVGHSSAVSFVVFLCPFVKMFGCCLSLAKLAQRGPSTAVESAVDWSGTIVNAVGWSSSAFSAPLLLSSSAPVRPSPGTLLDGKCFVCQVPNLLCVPVSTLSHSAPVQSLGLGSSN